MEQASENTRREKLIQRLDDYIGFSEQKFKSHHIKTSEKLGWGRLLGVFINAYGGLLKDTELDQLRLELDLMKETLKQKGIINE